MAERRRLRPAVRRALIAAGAITIAAALAYGSTYSWLFAAASVRVEGVRRMSAEEVRDLGGIHVGANVFHLDVTAIEARLRRDPRIAAATVATDLPDVVVITVVERVPVAVAELEGGPAVVAGDGALLPSGPVAALPRIRAVSGELDDERRTSAAAALGAMSIAVRRAIETVYSSGDGTLVLETRDGVTVTYGPATEVGDKAASLRAVLEWARHEGIALTAIDLTVPTAPTARTADGTVTPT
jgi:cell division protein FtsQ